MTYMRKEGEIIPVIRRQCLSPVHHFIPYLLEKKGIKNTLADIDNPNSPLRRGMEKLHERYRLEGGLFPEIGQRIRESAFTPTAAKAVVVFEAVTHPFKYISLKTPHFEDVARTAGYLSSGIFGVETKSPIVRSSDSPWDDLIPAVDGMEEELQGGDGNDVPRPNQPK